jgi:uncharacterized protein (DUF302 family)
MTRDFFGVVQRNYTCFHGLRDLNRISWRPSHGRFYAWAMNNEPLSIAGREPVLVSAAPDAQPGFAGLARVPTNGESAALQKPHRLWMTGSFAVVMAALGPVQDRILSKRVFRQSPYSVGETVQRIEAEARHQGLSVLAELDGSQPVIVLGSSIGGTPVVMDRANSRPDVPLSVGVREREGGGVEVLLADDARARDSDWADLPSEVSNDLAALPRWVDRALS